MNALTNIYSVLNNLIGFNVIYGEPVTETTDPLITVSSAEGDEAEALLGYNSVIYSVISVKVYSAVYLTGYNKIQSVTNELKGAGAPQIGATFKKNCGSKYDKDKQKYIFEVQYKELN